MPPVCSLNSVCKPPLRALAPRTKTISAASLFVVGVVLLIIAATVPPYLQRRLDQAVIDATVITPESMVKQESVFRKFADPLDEDSSPVYSYYYLFHCTNPDKVMDGSELPNLVEKGPYVYRKLTYRTSVTFHSDEGNRVVRFVPNIVHEFQPSMTPSGLAETDMLVLPNYQVIGGYFQYQKGLLSAAALTTLLSATSDQYKLFRPFTVKDYLEGLNLINTNPSANSKWDEWYTGEGNPGLLGIYRSWKENGVSTSRPSASFLSFADTRANIISGTDGTRFHPFMPKCEEARVAAFVTETGRVIPLKCDGEYEFKGINLYKFVLTPESLQSKTDNPANEKFNMNYAGAFDVTSVNFIPMLLTKPHMLDADDLRAKVNGLNPQREIHDIVIGVEPLSGIAMDATKQLQVNFVASPFTYDGTDYFTGMPAASPLPAVWISEQGKIMDRLAKNFKKSVYGTQKAIKYLLEVGASLGAIFIVFAFFWILYEFGVAGDKSATTSKVSSSQGSDFTSGSSRCSIGDVEMQSSPASV